MIATNVNGPRRIKYGGVRDLVIGTRVAGPDGKVTKAGGHVVKNVTGYDLNKAHIGSLGTLGVLVEASLKIAPRPEVERSWFGVFQGANGAASALSALLRLPSPPAALEILNHRAARTAGLAVVPGQWVLLGAAEGFELQVQRFLTEFDSAAKVHGALSSEPLSERTAADLWRAYRAMAADLRWTSESLACRLAAPPSVIGTLCELAAGLGEPAVWGHGYGSMFWSIPQSVAENEAGLVDKLRRAAEAMDGALVVENWPASMSGVEVWAGTADRSPSWRRSRETVRSKRHPEPWPVRGEHIGSIHHKDTRSTKSHNEAFVLLGALVTWW